jgi:cystathionine gamma-synthase
MRLATLCVHAGHEPDPTTGALSPPLHLATTFRHGPAGERITGFEYARESNPTQERLERALAALDGAATSLAFASGMAAAGALLGQIEAGQVLWLPQDLYHGVRSHVQHYLRPRGVRIETLALDDPAVLEAHAAGPVDWIWCETPSNPRLRLTDITALSAIARRHGATLVVDSTFAPPPLQRPLALGADVVLHSSSKYLGGHSDVLGGVLSFARDDALAARCRSWRQLHGAVASPFASWLVLRGLGTLAARLGWQCTSARAIAERIQHHPALGAVHHPSLPSHPQHALAGRQMTAYGAMLALELAGGRAAA